MPKSILKKTSKQAEDTVAARHRELAIHHALIIQRHKDMENTIFESIEALIEYPFRTVDPAYPDPADIKAVKEHLSRFRPSDFDSAVQERNLDEKCGYMLCPRPRTKQNTKAEFRLLRRNGLQVVKTSDLEKWCTEVCARRAFYLRVQLSESPPWERSSAKDGGLQLLAETNARSSNADVDRVARDLQKLAIERNDTLDSFRAKSVQVPLHERFEDMIIDQPVAPSLEDGFDGSRIEGYSSMKMKGRIPDTLDLDMIKDGEDVLDSI